MLIAECDNSRSRPTRTLTRRSGKRTLKESPTKTAVLGVGGRSLWGYIRDYTSRVSGLN